MMIAWYLTFLKIVVYIPTQEGWDLKIQDIKLQVEKVESNGNQNQRLT